MIGTSDQSCWLAEACKILLLLQGTWQSCTFVVPVIGSHMAIMLHIPI